MDEQYNFDTLIDRSQSKALKWDAKVLKERFGRQDILPFWVADMDLPSPLSVAEILKERAEHGIYGYPAGNQAFLKAWQSWMEKEHSWSPSLEKANFTPGIVGAMGMGVHLFSSPGEAVILQEPVYKPFRKVILHNERVPLVNPLKLSKGEYAMDFEDLEKKAARKDVRLMLLCSPHNPGGRIWNREELAEVNRICRKHGVFVISDEIHGDLALGKKKHIPYASLSEATAAGSMTLTAPSKTFNIAGEKLAIAYFGDKKQQGIYTKAQEAFGTAEAAALALLIGEAAYKEGGPWLRAVKSHLNGNLDYMKNYLNENLKGIELMEPDASFLAWLDFRALKLDEKTLKDRLANKGKIALVEGSWFGQGGKGFFRLNYGCPRGLLEEGMKRLSASLADNLVH